MRKVKIVIVEDLSSDIELIERKLESLETQCEVRVVADEVNLCKVIKTFKPDIVLSDYKLPGFSGMEALKIVKEADEDIAFIIVTGSMNEMTAVECLKAGAWDYVIKEKLEKLVPAIESALKNRKLLKKSKASLAALRESENRFHTLIEQSNDAIYLLYNGRFEIINNRFTEMFGYTLKECNKPDFNFMTLVAPESRQMIIEREEALKRGESVPKLYEFTALTKWGRRIICEASVAHFNYKEGIATQGIIRDITSRKRAEQQIRILSKAVEQNPASIVITGTDAEIEYVNSTFTKITGYPFEEVVGKNPRILQSGQTPRERYDELWETITSGKVWEGEFINRKKDGSIFYEKAWISPIFDEQGKISHYLGVKEDITEKRQLQEQFLQSQKMEAIGQLAGGIAHDFNNLLTVINGYVEVIISSIDRNSPFFEDLYEIKHAGEKAASLTRQLLAFSRKQIMKPRVFNLNNLLKGLEKMLGRLIGEHINLITVYDRELKPVKADPGQLEQVVLNLAVNARDAMPEGGRLSIETRNVRVDEEYARLHRGMRGGEYVLLSISDTGIGMDEYTREHIFEPFFTTKGKGKGTGLGLSTVYGIVRQSGGFVWVYSEPGMGTEIKVYLPAAREEEARRIEKEAEKKTLTGSETIIVAEDEEIVREFIVSVLKNYGYTVLVAKNKNEALEIALSHEGGLDLLLSDVVMPGGTGVELANDLRKKHPELKVLLMSGYSDEAFGERGLSEFGGNFIQKPFSIEELAEKVRNTLDSS